MAEIDPDTEAMGGSCEIGALLRGVRFAYDGKRGTAPFTLAIDHLELKRGETIACIGPSGSGKTTLVHLCAGILVPNAGEVHLAGQRIDRLSDGQRRQRRAEQIGLVFQEFELLDYLTARDNVLLPYRLIGARRHQLHEARERAQALADRLGIAALLERVPKRLSQGERQRVAIARALVAEPALVLCDEPTGNLDPTSAATVLDMLLGEAKGRGAALLMVTHDHSLLERFDRVIDVRDLHGDAP